MKKRMPTLFAGHGSPMNAIADNAYTRTMAALGARLPRPDAILVISAHWQTRGAAATASDAPPTIHDFGGFPEALYRVSYPAPGSPALAARAAELVGAAPTLEWGLDHGAWSVLRHLYPDASIPVVQLGLEHGLTPREHLERGARLRPLRDEGVLILGSGNLVHNLRRIDFDDGAEPFDWAVEFDAWTKEKLAARDFAALAGDLSAVPSGRLAVPTREHYDPVLYAAGASDADDAVRFEFDEIQNGSIAMRSVSFGA